MVRKIVIQIMILCPKRSSYNFLARSPTPMWLSEHKNMAERWVFLTAEKYGCWRPKKRQKYEGTKKALTVWIKVKLKEKSFLWLKDIHKKGRANL